MRRACGIAQLFLLLLPGQAFGQTMTSFVGGSGSNFSGTATFTGGGFLLGGRVITGAPYSGEEVIEIGDTLANGAHETHGIAGRGRKTWRDSKGRVRTEDTRMFGSSLRPGTPIISKITDPVAGCSYLLDSIHKIAHRTPLAAVAERNRAAPAQASRAGAVSVFGDGRGGRAGVGMSGLPQPRSERPPEPLGTKVIDGTTVEGFRGPSRMFAPSRGPGGGTLETTVTLETWRSKALDLVVLSLATGPDGTFTTTRIANLSTVEPDPSLFMVPPGYTIVDETESFTIKWE